MQNKLIVTRHRGALQWLAHCFGGAGITEFGLVCDNGEQIPVSAQATADEVRGKVVYGNLPLHLACLAREVWAIEFEGQAPRGQEYGLKEMQEAGACLRKYTVLSGQTAPWDHPGLQDEIEERIRNNIFRARQEWEEQVG